MYREPMAETAKTDDDARQRDAHQPTPIESTTVRRGLIDLPDARALWRRWRKPATD